jgi:hypothetical protein
VILREGHRDVAAGLPERVRTLQEPRRLAEAGSASDHEPESAALTGRRSSRRFRAGVRIHDGNRAQGTHGVARAARIADCNRRGGPARNLQCGEVPGEPARLGTAAALQETPWLSCSAPSSSTTSGTSV